MNNPILPYQGEPLGWSVTDAARMLNCSRPTVYRLLQKGQLDCYRIGEDQRVTTESIRRYTGVSTLKHAPREAA